MSAGALSGVLAAMATLGGLSGLAALYKVFVDRTKVRADAVGQIADTSVKMLAPLHEEIGRLSAKLRATENEVDELRKQIRRLSDQAEEAETLRTRLRERERALEALREENLRLMLGTQATQPGPPGPSTVEGT